MRLASPLSIAIFGATGHIGSAIAAEAVARSHHVSAISRHASLATFAAGITAVDADVLDRVAIGEAVGGHDAVVAALAGRAPGTAHTVPDAARLLLAVLPEAGVRRLVFVGGGGSLHDRSGRRFIDDPGFPEQYKAEALAAAEALDVFRSSDTKLNWSYLSPPPMYLLDGDKTGSYRAQAGDLPVTDDNGECIINLGDLAAVVVDAIEHDSFPCQRFTVGY